MPDLGLMSGGGQIGGQWGGWGDLLNRGLDIASQYLSLPQGTSIDLPGSDFGSGDPLSTSTWRAGTAGFRQIPTLVIPSPDGRLGFWKASGRPILFAGDLAACKRVSRVAMRASRAVGRSNRGGSRRRGGR